MLLSVPKAVRVSDLDMLKHKHCALGTLPLWLIAAGEFVVVMVTIAYNWQADMYWEFGHAWIKSKCNANQGTFF